LAWKQSIDLGCSELNNPVPAQDKPAAQVLREFMREYVSTHKTHIPKQTASAARVVQRKRSRE